MHISMQARPTGDFEIILPKQTDAGRSYATEICRLIDVKNASGCAMNRINHLKSPVRLAVTYSLPQITCQARHVSQWELSLTWHVHSSSFFTLTESMCSSQNSGLFQLVRTLHDYSDLLATVRIRMNSIPRLQHGLTDERPLQPLLSAIHRFVRSRQRN